MDSQVFGWFLSFAVLVILAFLGGVTRQPPRRRYTNFYQCYVCGHSAPRVKYFRDKNVCFSCWYKYDLRIHAKPQIAEVVIEEIPCNNSL
jgi:hypothetical protein